MNNCQHDQKSNGKSQADLKHALEEQLDLIIRMEDDRKNLKRQNKALNQKYAKAIDTIQKFTVSKVDKSVQTEELFTLQDDEQQQLQKQIQKQSQKEKKIIESKLIQQKQQVVKKENIDRGCQVDLAHQQQQNHLNLSNNSKLHEAMSYLKAIDTTTQQSRIYKGQHDYSSHSSILQNQHIQRLQQQQTTRDSHKDKQKEKKSQITTEIVKMSKEIASLKRQLKESEQKSKQKQKQLRQTKKCLETKSQILQKTRKQFNELSTLFNTDKYKSVRTLEAETQKYRLKAMKIDQQAEVITDLKGVLESLTSEYDQYRTEKQRKICSLIQDLKAKSQKIEELEIIVGQCKNEIKLMQYT